MTFEQAIIAKTRRVPLPPLWEPTGTGATVARQLDAVLLQQGFKLSGELLATFGRMSEGNVLDLALYLLPAVKHLTGAHVQHNAYFRDFPEGVPDTMEFWAQCLMEAFADPANRERIDASIMGVGEDTITIGYVNLLSLDSYGRYKHSYEDMVAAHQELIPLLSDRVTVLELGGTTQEEAASLFALLAGSRIPLDEADRVLLAQLAAEVPMPVSLPLAGPLQVIPVRENRAIINAARLKQGLSLFADTVTDVLRAACAVSGGDVTLEKPTKFISFRRPQRRVMMEALEAVVGPSTGKLADVAMHREQWKRLGERLHPHEYPGLPSAGDVFTVARGEVGVPSVASLAEQAFRAGRPVLAATHLERAPGMLWRNLDRLLRQVAPADRDAIAEMMDRTSDRVSGRVLLSVREHLMNRTDKPKPGTSRVFTNRRGRAWVTPDTRPAIGARTLSPLLTILDAEVSSRLPQVSHLLVDPDVLGVALPLSGKNTAPGLGILPRGSVTKVTGELLRFFIYWKQKEERTDYDLSVALLGAQFSQEAHISWTNLTAMGGAHSGDITSASHGASEFIDLNLARISSQYIVPQVLVFSGEPFGEAEEAFFGYMERASRQRGLPFEPRTVRAKSDLVGLGATALPLAFMRGEDGTWRAKWMHLYTGRTPSYSTVEANKPTASLLMRGIVEHSYLQVRDLVSLWTGKGASFSTWTEAAVRQDALEGTLYIGLQRPESLPEEIRSIDLTNLAELIPA